LLAGGKVIALGSTAKAVQADKTITLGQGEIALPAFVDHHLHLLSAVAAESSIDCSGKPNIGAVLEAITRAASQQPEDSWVRAVGYDDALLTEQRHPSASELDQAGAGRPVVLHHATGHAAVLSSAALKVVCSEPRTIDSEAGGLLIDRNDLLSKVPRLPESELRVGLGRVSEKLFQAGVVAVSDTTHTNDFSSLQFLDRLLSQIESPIEVSAMLGWDRLTCLPSDGYVGKVKVVAAKIMPIGDRVVASADGKKSTLEQAVAAVHSQGFAAAIHVIGYDILEQTIAALVASPAPKGVCDRIEHCSLAFPDQLDRLAELSVEVVTQPSFLSHRGVKYRRQLSPVEHDWLYPVASLLERGLKVRFSSDAPVVPSIPLEWVAAAVARELAPEEAVDLQTALRLSSLGPLRLGGDSRLAVLSTDKQSVVTVLGA